jgi:hypothetical protein
MSASIANSVALRLNLRQPFFSNDGKKIMLLDICESIRVAARSKAWTAFARSKAGIVGSNPTQSMNFVCAFILC